MKNSGGCLKIVVFVILAILLYTFVVSGLGIFGLSLGIIGAILIFTSERFREWFVKQPGYRVIQKLPGMTSTSPKTFAIVLFCYLTIISFISWLFLTGVFTKVETTTTAAIMGLFGIGLLIGWFIKGWGLKKHTEDESFTNITPDLKNEVTSDESNETSDQPNHKYIFIAAIVAALIMPFLCGGSGLLLGSTIAPESTATQQTPETELVEDNELALDNTPNPTSTSQPENTPKPTQPPEFTATPEPTNTSRPTETPEPQNTVEPTATITSIEDEPETLEEMLKQTLGDRLTKYEEGVYLPIIEIEFRLADSFGGVDLKTRLDVKEILDDVQESGIEFETIEIVGTFPLVDQSGKSTESKVIWLTFTEDVVMNTNWVLFHQDNLYDAADHVNFHPAYAAEMEETPFEQQPSSGIGLSRSDFTTVFSLPEVGFTFEESSEVDGQPRLIGTAQFETAFMELIGPPDDLTQVSVMVGVSDDEDEYMLNLMHMVGFLGIAMPDWAEGNDWLIANNVVTTLEDKVTTTVNNKIVTFEYFSELDLLLLMVEAE